MNYWRVALSETFLRGITDAQRRDLCVQPDKDQIGSVTFLPQG